MRSARVIAALAPAILSLAAARAQDAIIAGGTEFRIHRSPQTGRVVFLSAARGATGTARIQPNAGPSAPLTPEAFIESLGPVFGLSDAGRQLTQVSSKDDDLGFSHTRFAQAHRGVPVFAGALIVHQDAQGRFTALNGHFHAIPQDLGVIPALNSHTAAAIAASTLERAKPHDAETRLVIVDPGWYDDPPMGPGLAWHILIHDDIGEADEAFFIDARSGKVLDQWSTRHSARDRRVHDGEGMSEFPGIPRRFEGDPPVIDPADVDRAYDYLGDFYDFLHRGYGWDGPDGHGRPLITTANAGFSGCPNAFWNARLRQTVFCTGTAVDDIVAHEAMHAVTHYTADLIFQNQPGQLNESFSDVFGELVDLFNGDVAFLGGSQSASWPMTLTGPGADEPNLPRSSLCNNTSDYPDGLRWLIGEEAVFGLALRDMWNPTCYGMPDRANHPFQTCPRVDNGGAHTGSSIPNHAFAILTDGTTFNGYTVRGIGPIKAGAVWFRALTHYMTAADNFLDAYLALNQAAADLVGTYPNDPRTGLPSADMFTEDDASQVDLALRAVEMDTPSLCGIQPVILRPDAPPDCAAKRVVFADDFESDAGGWTVGNSGPPTPYEWRRVSDLPLGREGVAYFCPDEDYGDCVTVDESAVHELTSPPIHLPADAQAYHLRFTHYVATEPGYDGGNVSLRLASGRWVALSHQDFLFNPYNALLRSEPRGSTNPLAGRSGWTSAGGGWGTSIVDLSRWVSPGDTIQLRLSFGKDACNGSHGWYVDDVELYACPDCDRNGTTDDDELHFRAASNPLSPIGFSSPRSFTVTSPPVASGEVSVDLWAAADLGNVGEFLTLSLNGAALGDVFVGTGRDCPNEADQDSVSIPAPFFNNLVAGSDAVFTLTGSPVVDTGICGANNFVAMAVRYRTMVEDSDENRVIDHCENCSIAEPVAPEPTPIAKNRYISFAPANAGRLTSLRVSVVSIPSPFDQDVAEPMWVNVPWRTTADGHAFARLACEQVFHDWEAYAVVHVGDDEIVPGAQYEIRALDLACTQDDVQPPERMPGAVGFQSPPVAVHTAAAWGDVNDDSPDPAVANAQDVARLVDILRGPSTTAEVATGDLQPAVPDGRVDARDVAAVVDAARGRTYPFSVECLCCPGGPYRLLTVP